MYAPPRAGRECHCVPHTSGKVPRSRPGRIFTTVSLSSLSPRWQFASASAFLVPTVPRWVRSGSSFTFAGVQLVCLPPAESQSLAHPPPGLVFRRIYPWYIVDLSVSKSCHWVFTHLNSKSGAIQPWMGNGLCGNGTHGGSWPVAQSFRQTFHRQSLRGSKRHQRHFQQSVIIKNAHISLAYWISNAELYQQMEAKKVFISTRDSNGLGPKEETISDLLVRQTTNLTQIKLYKKPFDLSWILTTAVQGRTEGWNAFGHPQSGQPLRNGRGRYPVRADVSDRRTSRPSLDLVEKVLKSSQLDGCRRNVSIRSAFMFWIMAILCLQFSVTPGAYFMALSGSMLLLANMVWALLSPALKSRPPVVLLGSAALQLQLGWTFYLCLFTGLLAVVLAIALLLVEGRDPTKAATFFGLDPRSVYDEYYCSKDDNKFLQQFFLSLKSFWNRCGWGGQLRDGEPVRSSIPTVAQQHGQAALENEVAWHSQHIGRSSFSCPMCNDGWGGSEIQSRAADPPFTSSEQSHSFHPFQRGFHAPTAGNDRIVHPTGWEQHGRRSSLIDLRQFSYYIVCVLGLAENICREVAGGWGHLAERVETVCYSRTQKKTFTMSSFLIFNQHTTVRKLR